MKSCDDPSRWQGGYLDGEYRIVKPAGSKITPGPCHIMRFSDFIAEIDAMLIPPTDDVYITFEFRLQSAYNGNYDNENSYAISVYPDTGAVTLARITKGNDTILLNASNERAMNRGGSRNRIGVHAQGDSITVLLNGQEIGRVRDTAYKDGLLAFAVGHKQDKRAEARFDNLLVSRVP